ncbi:MAG: guanylate kinase [Sarcina sp.]
MGKIFCIMGKSSSGKDTIFKMLTEDESLKLKEIVTYTTRPIRNNETNGVEYNFIDLNRLEELKNLNKIIELRCYHTVNGDWNYLTVDDGKIDLENNNYITILTLEAYNSYKKYYGKDKVYPIYIDLEDATRLKRAIEREEAQTNPNFEELCRRFIADNKDFSEENLKESEIEEKFLNYDLDKIVLKIKKYINDNN